MRTTLTINDQLAAALKKRAYESGKSFKDVVNEVLQAGLHADNSLPQAKPYRLKPASLGNVQNDLDMNKALHISASLEDQEIARKLHMRK